MATLLSSFSLHSIRPSSSTLPSSSTSSPSFVFFSFPLRTRSSSLKARTQPVVVPVSPSDTLTMFFQAEGTLSESAIPALTKALEETEGVTDLKVQLSEGLAILELKKQTTVQATGVASGLVETIQGSGFKLQTLNLSFEDEEVAVA
ncbi:uncharacterized protein HKW66_Vig0255780 [Vigna angularis]|uniref:HMA domain-containing protein n=1 Tax=Phaseolus angularis TaxID=3914 RepID=A0A8T0JTV6_PHAAN|nr:uncharacterized protein HKW66_Vig0255780 [Vigna angularis]